MEFPNLSYQHSGRALGIVPYLRQVVRLERVLSSLEEFSLIVLIPEEYPHLYWAIGWG
jgi:hypothetical protein